MTVTNIHFADPVLLKVTVELSETQKELLNVRQSDLSSPNGVVNLAERFCVSHGLDTGKIQKPLEEHIKSNIKGYLERQQQQQNQSNQDLNSQTQQYQVQQQNLLSNTGNGSINGGGGSLSSTARPPLAASNNGNISTAAAPSTVLTNISSATANTNTNTTSNITSQQYQPSQGTQTTSVGAGVGIQAPTVTKLSKLLENLQSQAEAAAAQNGKGRTKIPASYTTPLSARGPGHLSARDLSQNKHLKYHNTPNFTQVQHNLNNTTTTTTAAAKQREQLTGYLEKKIKQSREDRSNVFARLHQDASEKAIRLDLHRKMVDDHVKMRANQSPRKETGNGKGLGANSALALTQTMDSARNHHERGDRGGGANTNGGQGKGTNSGSDTPPMSNSELSRLSIFGKNQHREKLYQDAREKRMRLLRKQQQQESQKQWEEQQHTYQPDIVRSQARVSGLNRPVHTQTTAMQRLREREIHREKINQHVNNNDQKIQYNRNNGGGNGPGGGGGGTTTSAQSQNSNKHSDNVGWGVRDGFCKSQRVLQKMDLIRQEKSEIELAECTFRPKIDKRSQ